MENSVLFLLSKLYNMKAASILSVSDLPGHPKYDLFNANTIHQDMETGIENAIKITISSLPKIKALLEAGKNQAL
jgi:purine-nucleoside phosphorylase